MTDTARIPRIQPDRLWQRHMKLAEIGALPAGGVNRQALTPGDAQARKRLMDWGAEIGLEAAVDPIGNLFLRRAGRNPDSDPVLAGSHLDTQPTGGKFDGAYGVLAALEALTVMDEAGLRTRRPIDLVIWNNEEGCRFAPTTMGSSVFVGELALNAALATRDSDGTSVREALGHTQSLAPTPARRPLGFPVAAYLEAHIEQGPVLERHECPIGIVTGIQGLRWMTVEVRGRESHAGTTPRRYRRDALMAAMRALSALQALCEDEDDVLRFTVGRFKVSPGAPNTIPGHVAFSIDLRHPDPGTLRQIGDRIATICAQAAAPCSVTVNESIHSRPVQFPKAVTDLLSDAADELSLARLELISGATHDAKWLNQVTPTGMIFVPCADGISHSEHESAEPEALARGAQVLCHALARIAEA